MRRAAWSVDDVLLLAICLAVGAAGVVRFGSLVGWWPA
jgi:hypothetical protein